MIGVKNTVCWRIWNDLCGYLLYTLACENVVYFDIHITSSEVMERAVKIGGGIDYFSLSTISQKLYFFGVWISIEITRKYKFIRV